MPRTTAEKLQIKPNTELLLLGGTAEQRALLAPLPQGVTTHEDAARGSSDAAVLFAPDRAALDVHLAAALPHLGSARATWIAYPKGNRTDIHRDSIWARAEEIGWTATANVSLDNVWSAVRIKPAA